ncbi:hypothetical protein CDL15_Pgr022332 [Punica granatum]|nr:hypothetical protein CDL15_Pgr022332 [Punica granatum]
MRRYDTFSHYYSSRAALGEPESPIEDTLAHTSPPYTQEVEVEIAYVAPTSKAVEVPCYGTVEASVEVKAAQEAPQPEAELP